MCPNMLRLSLMFGLLPAFSDAFFVLPFQSASINNNISLLSISATTSSSDGDNNTSPGVRSLPNKDESWFVKTEQFCKPFPEVKPHLEAHRKWVTQLRADGHCITSGYRVDRDGKPGGGGMMFLAAKSYDDAEEMVLSDPLVANGCVDWRLNGWIAEVGDIQLR